MDTEAYDADIHAMVGCTGCHGGENEAEKELAHSGLIPDPSEHPEASCAKCHDQISETHSQSLHKTLAGYDSALAARSAAEDAETWHALDEMQANHCDNCHATCGQCHISQPASVGGGLLEGHSFVSRPPMSRSCTACHGSRIGDEYTGKNEDLMPDVHFRQARMTCVDCHDQGGMHGSEEQSCQECHDTSNTGEGLFVVDHRYDGPPSPSCKQCHETVGGDSDGVTQHALHGELLSCQVCHSVAYKNCYGCHTYLDEDGEPYFETEGSEIAFRIGLNPSPDYHRPYKYVPVRHVPIAPDSFSFYGDELLSNFSRTPTWRLTTPHNIQRITPQNQSCGSCHGSEALFLTADKVAEGELDSNESIIVIEAPNPLE